MVKKGNEALFADQWPEETPCLCLGVQSRVRRHFPMSLLAVLPVLLLSFAVSTEAVARAFAPCDAVAVGFTATAAVDTSDPSFEAFCSAVVVAGPDVATSSLNFTATGTGSLSVGGNLSSSASPEGSAATALVSVNGGEVISASASSGGKRSSVRKRA